MGITLVSLAFIFAPREATSQFPDQRLEAVVGKAPERNFIKVTDANDDGIPDWQETLAEAEKLPTLQTDQSAGVASEEPETLTDKFALSFTKDVMQSNMYGTLDKNKSLLINSTSQQLSTEIEPDFYEYTDLTISPNNSQTTLRAYGNRIAAISFNHSLPESTRDTLEIAKEIGLTENKELLDELQPIITAYKGLLDDTLNTPAPEKVLEEHLALVNAYLLMYEDTASMNDFFTDPMNSLLHLYRYQEDSANLISAIKNLYLKLDSLGVKFDETDITSKLLTIEPE